MREACGTSELKQKESVLKNKKNVFQIYETGKMQIPRKYFNINNISIKLKNC
jgi:hypothetical protein